MGAAGCVGVEILLDAGKVVVRVLGTVVGLERVPLLEVRAVGKPEETGESELRAVDPMETPGVTKVDAVVTLVSVAVELKTTVPVPGKGAAVDSGVLSVDGEQIDEPGHVPVARVLVIVSTTTEGVAEFVDPASVVAD